MLGQRVPLTVGHHRILCLHPGWALGVKIGLLRAARDHTLVDDHQELKPQLAIR